MKAWLPVLLEKFNESPVLAFSVTQNMARAALFDREGNFLAGGLESQALLSMAAEESRMMHPGDCCVTLPPGKLVLECLMPDEKSFNFWTQVQENLNGAWASWLLTMPRLADGSLKISYHLLSTFGPWSVPKLPEQFREHWALLPLKPGLSRLFIFGDDALARETATLAARTGITVTWVTSVEQDGPELDEARNWGDFCLLPIEDWAQIDDEFLTKIGFTRKAQILVTTPNQTIFETMHSAQPAYLARSGEAEGEEALFGSSSGLFTNPATTTHKALGLIAEMLR